MGLCIVHPTTIFLERNDLKGWNYNRLLIEAMTTNYELNACHNALQVVNYVALIIIRIVFECNI